MIKKPLGENLEASCESCGISSCCFRSPPAEEEIFCNNVRNIKIVLIKEYPHFVQTPETKKVGSSKCSNKDLSDVYQSLGVESTNTSKSQQAKKPLMSPYLMPSHPVSTPKQKASAFLNCSKSNIEFEATSTQVPRVNHFFFTPNLRKSLAPEDKKLDNIRFNLYTMQKAGVRTKSLEKLEKSLSR